jgi:DNA-binding MarR family transcriptional regulator
MGNKSSSRVGPGHQASVVEAERSSDVLTVASQLRPVLLRLHRYLRGEAHELGVTSTQASLLAAIECSPDIGLVELAEREHMSAPTLVSHIDKLEAAGLVTRTRNNPADRRRVGLTITEKGSQTVQTLRERRTAWLAARLEMLSPEALAAIAAAIEPLQQLARSDV